MELVTLVYVLLILAFAKAFGELVSRFNQPAIVGELLAGIILGPFVLGEIFSGLENMYTSSGDESAQFINDLAEFGMLFLMLYAGLEFSPKAIRESSWAGAAIAAVGLAVPMVGGLIVGYVFGFEGLTLAFLAVALGVTALPVTIRVLEDLGVIQIRTSNVIVSAALITDVVVMLALGLLLSANAHEGGLPFWDVVVMSLGFVSFFVLAMLIGKYVVPYVYELLKRMRTGEAAFAVAIGFAIGFAILAYYLGLPPVIGAFIAGVLLRETGSGLKVWAGVQDVLAGVTIGFFAPIFFVEIGFAVDFDALATSMTFFVAIVAVAVVGKLIGSYLPARACGYGKNESKAISSMMMGKGAMELVFASLAYQEGLIQEDVFSVLILMAFVSTMIAPIMFRHYFNRAVEAEEIPPPKGKKRHVGLIDVSR